jgi:hypothetical protein
VDGSQLRHSDVAEVVPQQPAIQRGDIRNEYRGKDQQPLIAVTGPRLRLRAPAGVSRRIHTTKKKGDGPFQPPPRIRLPATGYQLPLECV